jgi:hypothetical protein
MSLGPAVGCYEVEAGRADPVVLERASLSCMLGMWHGQYGLRLLLVSSPPPVPGVGLVITALVPTRYLLSAAAAVAWHEGEVWRRRCCATRFSVPRAARWGPLPS